MWDLFQIECLRYRKAATLLAIAHFCVIAFLNKMADLLQLSQQEYAFWIALYFVPTCLFGFWQGHSYAKPNQWLHLLHRPVSPRKIALGLISAGLALLSLAIVLPLALNLLLATQYTERVMDSRHYLLPLSAFFICAAAYLCGLLLRVSANRWPWLLLPMLAAAWMAPATGMGALIVQAIGFVAMLWLTTHAFQPDRRQASRASLALVLALLSCQIGAHVSLIAAGNFLYQFTLLASGQSPNNNVPPVGGYHEAEEREAGPALALLLDGSTEQKILREQLNHSQAKTFPGAAWQGVHHAFTGEVAFSDANNNRWSYSHDERRFIGINRRSRLRVASLGPAGAPFQDLPRLVDARRVDADLIAAGPHLYRYDPKALDLKSILSLPAAENIAGGYHEAGAYHLVLGSAALHFFQGEGAQNSAQNSAPSAFHFSLPLPAPVAELANFSVAELDDSYLVTFLYGEGNFRGESLGRQYLYQLDLQGRSKLLAQRSFSDDYAAAYMFDQQLLSPVLTTIGRALRPYVTAIPARPQRPTPFEIQVMSGILCLLSVLGATVWLKEQRMSVKKRAALLSFSALGGLPALLALSLVLPRPQSFPFPIPTAARA